MVITPLDPDQAILDLAAEQDADLILMATSPSRQWVAFCSAVWVRRFAAVPRSRCCSSRRPGLRQDEVSPWKNQL